MTKKPEENMKAIPIKNYDFQVDFKVDDNDVMETFLDPEENKHISIPKRPMTSKYGTFGTPKPLPGKFSTVQAKEMDLTIKGTANPVTESVKSDNPLPTNLFHFKTHLPTKKLSDNPKLALGMFKKKTISAKSGKTIMGSDNFAATAGPEGFSQAGSLQRPQTATQPGVQGIQSSAVPMTGKKLTAKGAALLKETKESNALKSSGAAHGLFGKVPDVKEGKTGAQRPKSAVVSNAVGFMQDLKKTKKLRAPKKPEGYDDQDEEVEPVEDLQDKENNFNDKKMAKKGKGGNKQSGKRKTSGEDEEGGNEEEDDLGGTSGQYEKQVQAKKANLVKKKEVAKKKEEEEVEQENEEEEEDLGGTEGQYERIMKSKKEIAKKSKGQPKEIEEDEVEEIPSFEGEEQEEAEGQEEEKEGDNIEDGEGGGEGDEDLFPKEEEIEGTESMNPISNMRAKNVNAGKKGAGGKSRKVEEAVEEIASEEEQGQNDEENEENNENENENENNNENNNNDQEDDDQKSVGGVSQASSIKPYRSSIANELAELQANALGGPADSLSNISQRRGQQAPMGNVKAKKEAAVAQKETVEKKEKTVISKPKEHLVGANMKTKGGFVPYEMLNSIDGDVAQKQRDEVKDEITNYLRAADLRRQKRAEIAKGVKPYESRDTNEYTDKIENVNSSIKSSVTAMRSIIRTSKAVSGQQKKIIEVRDIDSSPEDDQD